MTQNALIEISPGDEADATVLDGNFTYLNGRISSTVSTIEGQINSLNGTLASVGTRVTNLETPSSSFKSTLLNLLYPVNSIYITVSTSGTCPIASTLGGTWTLVSTDRVLQGASSASGAGGTKAAGLPNITGQFSANFNDANQINHSVAFYSTSGGGGNGMRTGWNEDGTGNTTKLNASRSSSIYGSSSTVQPPAYLVNVWKRTA